MYNVTELPETIRNRIEVMPSGCWLWRGHLLHNGYGQVTLNNERYLIHRLVYAYLVARIATGLTIDHLCRIRACCNPDHLEAVPIRTNILRGQGLAAINARKTHCPQGHPYTPANTGIDISGDNRYCRTCMNARARARYRVKCPEITVVRQPKIFVVAS